MSFKESDVKELEGRDHEVLGADFCSGYTDIFGKWNTGFECPRAGNGKTVYCCGTLYNKYCCTKRDQQPSSGISQSVILGFAFASVLVIIVVTLVSCLIFRRCIPCRRAHTSLNGGPLYTMHCSRSTSGLTNLYSFSGQTTTTTTPLDTPHVLLGMEGPENHIYAMPMNGPRSMNRHLVLSEEMEIPSYPPPPYQEGHEANHNSFPLQSPPESVNHNRRPNNSSESTKF